MCELAWDLYKRSIDKTQMIPLLDFKGDSLAVGIGLGTVKGKATRLILGVIYGCLVSEALSCCSLGQPVNDNVHALSMNLTRLVLYYI